MVSSKTKLVFLTDGMLIRALMNDPLLQDHSYVFIDEAHERTINSDILIGVLKDLVS
jgi:HrpA-like RNA helicase